MIEFWLVITSACFNAMLTSYNYKWIDSYHAQRECFDQILISDVEPTYPLGTSNLFAIVNPEKWRRALRYCGDDIKTKYKDGDLGFVANDYAFGTYQKHFGQLPTSTQVKILEKISLDNEINEKNLWYKR